MYIIFTYILTAQSWTSYNITTTHLHQAFQGQVRAHKMPEGSSCQSLQLPELWLSDLPMYTKSFWDCAPHDLVHFSHQLYNVAIMNIESVDFITFKAIAGAWGVRTYFWIGGYKNIAHKAHAKFFKLDVHPSAFKLHPFCASLAVKWVLTNSLSNINICL